MDARQANLLRAYGRLGGGLARAVLSVGPPPARRRAARSEETPPNIEDVINESPELYTMIRLWIEAGAEHRRGYEQTGSWPTVSPTADELAARVAYYLPAIGEEGAFDVYALSPQEAAYQETWSKGQPDSEAWRLAPSLRRADVVFRDRERLVDELNKVAPKAAAAIKAEAPDADDWGLELWAVALVAGGVLVAIGRLSWQGALISSIAGYLLLGASAIAGFTFKTAEGKTITERAYEAVQAAAQKAAEGAKSIAWIIGLVAGAVGLLLVVLGVIGLARRSG